MITIANYIESELDEVAKTLLSKFQDISVWCFFAEMGMGKTTLIKQICMALNVVDPMSSPSFSIVNEYQTLEGRSLYHFDLYRLSSMEEAFNIGLEEYLDSGNLCLLEWPEIIEPLLPEQYLEICIKLEGENARSLIAQPK